MALEWHNTSLPAGVSARWRASCPSNERIAACALKMNTKSEKE